MPMIDIGCTFDPGYLLPKLVQHPRIAPQLKTGLGGSTFIDHVIGVVETALEQGKDTFLEDCYRALQDNYPLYFTDSSRNIPLEAKPNAYKACNGF
ncbi:MAG: hypothetical protein Q7K45_03290 [Nanoarchaeota archaeon]|nr:hypothetical protein [Nanoarchaeota archaeon]